MANRYVNETVSEHINYTNSLPERPTRAWCLHSFDQVPVLNNADLRAYFTNFPNYRG